MAQLAPPPDSTPLPTDLDRSAPVLRDVEAGIVSTGSATSLQKENDLAAGRPAAARNTGRKGGLTEGDEDEPDLPKNRLIIVVPCLSLVLFLAALDQTIIATALPTIAEVFNASPSSYSWVITSYQVAMTLLTPVNGRLSDIVGRKPLLYVAIILFTIGSALCGCAQSINWLIGARFLQGCGGGTVIGLCSIVISDIVPLNERGKYQGIMGASWGIAAVLGPILGGLLTSRVSWRWCFYINLPTCGVAFVLLAFTLKLNPPRGKSFAELKRTFDFVGMILAMAGATLAIVGFSMAADHGFTYKTAIALIVVGIVLFAASIVNCMFTERNAVIPARIFRVRTTLFFMIASSLQAAAFIPSNVILPMFFQGVHGADALESGIQLLPYAIFVSVVVMIGGMITSRFHIVRPIPWVGYCIGMLGFGLLYGLFNYDITLPMQYGILIIPAVGVGLSLQTPLLIMQAAMPLKDMAAVTSAWVLTRSLGGSVGISIALSVDSTSLRHRMSKIPGYGTDFVAPTSAEGYQLIHRMPEGETKTAILKAFADSFKPWWIASIGLFAACLLITIPTRSYSLNRTRGGGPVLAKDDPSSAQSTPTPASESERDIKLEEREEGKEATDGTTSRV